MSHTGYNAIPAQEVKGDFPIGAGRTAKYGPVLCALLIGIAIGFGLVSISMPIYNGAAELTAANGWREMLGLYNDDWNALAPQVPNRALRAPQPLMCNPDNPATSYSLGELEISTSLEVNPSAEVLSRIGTAEREILMCVYKLSDPKILAALSEALRRGVSVKIIADKLAQQEGKGMRNLVHLARDGSRMSELTSMSWKERPPWPICEKARRLHGSGALDSTNTRQYTGAHVRMWNEHAGYKKLHAKFSVFDAKVGMAGSNNGSKNAGRNNMELMLRFDMAPAVEQLVAKFNELFALGHDLRA